MFYAAWVGSSRTEPEVRYVMTWIPIGKLLEALVEALGLQPPPEKVVGVGFRGSNHLLRIWLEP